MFVCVCLWFQDVILLNPFSILPGPVGPRRKIKFGNADARMCAGAEPTGGLVSSWMLSSAMFTLLVITASRRILSNIGSVQRIENTDLLIIEQGLPLLL